MSLTLLLPIAIIVIGLLALGLLVTRLYRRAEKSSAYVRTGLGGQKVILDGGSVVLPVFHSINWVNLQTLRLDVRRDNQDAMITKDRMRVDIGVEFYVRVKPDLSSIALAAQTLGNRTNDLDQLRMLVEAKFVDALRSVAATMTLTDLQEKRADFVLAVQTAVSNDLQLNGLELESASLTKLDQTDTKFFNPSNAFDAEGLTALTRITELKKQERNQITRSAEVAIALQDLEAAQKTLEIKRQARDAELNQQRDIVNKTAATRAESAAKEADARLAEQSAAIAADQAVAELRALATQAQETARIAAEQAVEISKQNRDIAVAERSRAQSEAHAEAEKARAVAVVAEQAVETAKLTAQAERQRTIAVIAAQQDAEREAARVTIGAEAEKEAAANQAEAARLKAQGEADAVSIQAAAKARQYEVDAEGQRRINEARNLLAPQLVELEVVKARLAVLPEALAVAVKPLEKIGDVRIIDLNGWTGAVNGAAGGENGEQHAGSPADSLVNQLMRYRGNAPIIDNLLREAGFTGTNPVDALVSGAAGSREGAAR